MDLGKEESPKTGGRKIYRKGKKSVRRNDVWMSLKQRGIEKNITLS